MSDDSEFALSVYDINDSNVFIPYLPYQTASRSVPMSGWITKQMSLG